MNKEEEAAEQAVAIAPSINDIREYVLSLACAQYTSDSLRGHMYEAIEQWFNAGIDKYTEQVRSRSTMSDDAFYAWSVTQ